MHVADFAPWYYAWAYGVPVIVLNVIIHIGGLAAIHAKMTPRLGAHAARGRLSIGMFVVMALTVTAVGQADRMMSSPPRS